MRRVSVGFDGVIGVVPGPSVLTVSASVPLTSTDFATSLAVPQFDPALGTLVSVRFTLAGGIVAAVQAENKDPAPVTIVLGGKADETLHLPAALGGGAVVSVAPAVSTTFAASAFDGAVDFAGGSGLSLPRQTGNQAADSTPLTDAGTLAAFTGGGTVAMGLSVTASTSAISAGNLITSWNTQASAIVSVTYQYLPPPGEVTVPGASGDVVRVDFADVAAGSAAAAALAPLNAAISAGAAVPVTVGNGATIPAAGAGAPGVLLVHGGGVFALPDFYAGFADDAATAVTLSGGTAAGQLVLAGSGGLAFNAGAGSASVFAAGGANLVSAYPGAGDLFVTTGAGDDTVVALAGNATVNAGGGHNAILTGGGNDVINSTGTDLIAAGGSGATTINAGANDPVVFLGSGQSLFNGGTGRATVVSGSGAATINAAGGTQIWLGSGPAVVNSTGSDMVIGAAGASTLHGGNGLVALSFGATDFIGGSGAATVAGFAGALTVAAGGGGLFLGAPGGHNVITGGSSPSTIFGGGAGDVLRAGTGGGDVIVAGAGAETISAAAATGATWIYAGSGPDLISTGTGATSVLLGTGAATILAGSGLGLFAVSHGSHSSVTIGNFSPSADYLSLAGFPAGEAAAALTGATITAGDETLTLSDGTHITLLGFTGLTAANFL